MLVLNRKFGQKIHVGDDIILTIVRIDRNSIRIGIEAPADVPIRRDELAVHDASRSELVGSSA